MTAPVVLKLGGSLLAIPDLMDRLEAVIYTLVTIASHQEDCPDSSHHLVHQNLFGDRPCRRASWHQANQMQWITNAETVFEVRQIFHPAIESIAAEDVVVTNRLSWNLCIAFNEELPMSSHQCCDFSEISQLHKSPGDVEGKNLCGQDFDENPISQK
jgi:hypothetical protein